MDRNRQTNEQKKFRNGLTWRMQRCNLTTDGQEKIESACQSVSLMNSAAITTGASSSFVESVSVETSLPGLVADAVLTDALAIDCEGVGIGPKGKVNVAARVSLVNELGHCVYDTFVRQSELVADYRTWLTGIEAKHLETGRDIKEVQQDLKKLLKGRKLVGHALHNDFRMLRFEHPEHLIRDTSTYDPFRSLAGQCHPSLKTLAKLILNLTIHDGMHDPIVDARTAMQLYQTHKKLWEETEYGWPVLDTNPLTKEEINDPKKWL